MDANTILTAALARTHSHIEDLEFTPVRNRKNEYVVTGTQKNTYTGEVIGRCHFLATVHGNGDVQMWIKNHGTFAMIPAPTA